MPGFQSTARFACGILLCLLLLPGCNEGDSEPEFDTSVAPMQNSPFISSGIETPQAVAASDVQLEPDARVIGVVVEGKARAYSVAGMSGMSSHVINDLIGVTPISVTYCDQTDQNRAFTCEQTGQVIPLEVGGFAEEEMQIRLDGQMFGQTATDIPLTEFPSELTTWRDWLSRHPDCDVVTVSSINQPSSETTDSDQI